MLTSQTPKLPMERVLTEDLLTNELKIDQLSNELIPFYNVINELNNYFRSLRISSTPTGKERAKEIRGILNVIVINFHFLKKFHQNGIHVYIEIRLRTIEDLKKLCDKLPKGHKAVGSSMAVTPLQKIQKILSNFKKDAQLPDEKINNEFSKEPNVSSHIAEDTSSQKKEKRAEDCKQGEHSSPVISSISHQSSLKENDKNILAPTPQGTNETSNKLPLSVWSRFKLNCQENYGVLKNWYQQKHWALKALFCIVVALALAIVIGGIATGIGALVMGGGAIATIFTLAAINTIINTLSWITLALAVTGTVSAIGTPVAVHILLKNDKPEPESKKTSTTTTTSFLRRILCCFGSQDDIVSTRSQDVTPTPLIVPTPTTPGSTSAQDKECLVEKSTNANEVVPQAVTPTTPTPTPTPTPTLTPAFNSLHYVPTEKTSPTLNAASFYVPICRAVPTVNYKPPGLSSRSKPITNHPSRHTPIWIKSNA